MKMPIGFRSYQNDEEPDKQDELEKQQAERQKAIATSSARTIHPSVPLHRNVTRPPLNWYMSCRTLSMSLDALAKQLADAGYHVEYLAGQPYWVMYENAIKILTGEFFYF